MYYTIQNEALRLMVDTHGAQMMSLRAADGTEYLWQGDAAYWAERAPVLFPIAGRLQDEAYCYHGALYRMKLHGFAREQEFSLSEQTNDRLVFELKDTEKTRAQYPFAFSLQMVYQLERNTLLLTCRVENCGTEEMPFAIGLHPGFRVPLHEDERFEDYVLEFCEPCSPRRTVFSQNVLVTGQTELFALAQGRELPLRHELFDCGAIILQKVARAVRLRSKRSGCGVELSYPDFLYLGIWHLPRSDAPYVCLEPWTSLPGRDGVVEEFSQRADLIQLAPGSRYQTDVRITILEKKGENT